MANGGGNNTGTPTPEQLTAQEKLNQLLEGANKAASSYQITLQAVAESLELVDDANGSVAEQITLLDKQNERRNDLLEKQLKLAALGKKLTAEEAEELKELTEQTKEFRKALERANAARIEEIDLIKETMSLTAQLTGIQLENLTTLRGVVAETISFVHALDSANVQLAQGTGYTTAYRQELYDLVSANQNLGVTLDEGAIAFAGLAGSFSSFNAMTRTGRKEVGDLALQFSRMNVPVEETGRLFDNLQRGLGIAESALGANVKEFDRLAQQVGLPTSQMVADFNSLVPSIARYGSRAGQVFTKLTKQARQLGLQTQEAFDVAMLFDTFESSAGIAGQLNAQLGLQLNSTQLLRAEEGERLEILRKEFKERGIGFQDMGRRQKQMIAEIMGVDTDVAARLFGNPIALRRYQRETKETKERAELMTTAMQKFSVTLQNVFLSIEPIVTTILDFTRAFAESGVAKFLIYGAAITAFVKAIGFALGPFKLLMPLLSGLPVVSGFLAGFGSVAQVTTPITLKFAGAMALLGVAALGIGAGIAVAAQGLATLAESFNGLGENAGPAATAIIGFTVAFGLMMVALLALVSGPQAVLTGLAIGVLLSVGAAALAIGGGMRLAADGIANVIDSLSDLGRLEKGFSATLSHVQDLISALGDLGEKTQALDSVANVISVATKVSPPDAAEFKALADQVVKFAADLRTGGPQGQGRGSEPGSVVIKELHVSVKVGNQHLAGIIDKNVRAQLSPISGGGRNLGGIQMAKA
jgi:hypothetical protein